MVGAGCAARLQESRRAHWNNNQRGNVFYKLMTHSLNENQAWIGDAIEEPVAADAEFNLFFWCALSVLILWVSVLFFSQGRGQ